MEKRHEDERYLDELTDVDEKAADGKAQTPQKKERLSMILLCALNVAALVYLVVALHAYFAVKSELKAELNGEAAEPPAPMFFDVTKVNADLTPDLRGVKQPDGMSPDFLRLYAANDDVVGWIRIHGTCIDYPMLKGEDNDYYERRNYYEEHDERGSVWLDYRNPFGPGQALDNVSVVWGHSFSEHDLGFYELEDYLDVDYYKSHPLIETENLYGEVYRWKVFGCMITAVEDQDDNGQIFYYWNTQLAGDEQPAFVEEVYRRSWFRNPMVDVVLGDKLICLSTCTYMLNVGREYHEIRCVLFGRLLRDGESAEVDVSMAFQNPSPRMPQLYYDQKGIENPYRATPVFGF